MQTACYPSDTWVQVTNCSVQTQKVSAVSFQMVGKGRRRAGVGRGRNYNRKVLEMFSDQYISDFY